VLVVPAADFGRALRLVPRPQRCVGLQLQPGAVTLLYDDVDDDVLPRLHAWFELIHMQVQTQRVKAAVRRPTLNSLATMTA
jgi:hypothetical protein